MRTINRNDINAKNNITISNLVSLDKGGEAFKKKVITVLKNILHANRENCVQQHVTDARDRYVACATADRFLRGSYAQEEGPPWKRIFFSVFPLILYNKLSSRQGRDNIYIHVNVKRCVPLAVSEIS